MRLFSSLKIGIVSPEFCALWPGGEKPTLSDRLYKPRPAGLPWNRASAHVPANVDRGWVYVSFKYVLLSLARAFFGLSLPSPLFLFFLIFALTWIFSYAEITVRARSWLTR